MVTCHDFRIYTTWRSTEVGEVLKSSYGGSYPKRGETIFYGGSWPPLTPCGILHNSTLKLSQSKCLNLLQTLR